MAILGTTNWSGHFNPTGGSGYTLGSQQNAPGANNFVNAYRDILNARQQAENPIQQQIPDNYSKLDSFERGLSGLYNLGEAVSDPLGFNTTLESIKEDAANKRVSPFKVLSLAPKGVGAIIGGTFGGAMMAPGQGYEAVEGKNILENINGYAPTEKLTGEQRWAQGLNAAINGSVFVPGTGEFSLLKSAGRAGVKAFAKSEADDLILNQMGRTSVKDAAEGAIANEAKNAAKASAKSNIDDVITQPTVGKINRKNPIKEMLFSPDAISAQIGSKIAGNFVDSKKAKTIGGYIGAGTEEGIEEFVQEGADIVRGDEEHHGLSEITNNPGAALKRMSEAGAIGSILGMGAHGGAHLLTKVGNKIDEEQKKRLEKLQRSRSEIFDQYEAANADRASNIALSDPYEGYGENDSIEVEPEVAEKVESKTSEQDRTAGYSGTASAVSSAMKGGAIGNNATLGVANIINLLVNEKHRNTMTDWLRGRERVVGEDEINNLLYAVNRNNHEEASKQLNAIAKKRNASSDPLYFTLAKQPMTNETPVKMRVGGFDLASNVVGVDQAFQKEANADFDGDLITSMFSYDAIDGARLLSELFYDNKTGVNKNVLEDTTTSLKPIRESKMSDSFKNFLKRQFSDLNRMNITLFGKNGNPITIDKAIDNLFDENNTEFDSDLWRLIRDLEREGIDTSDFIYEIRKHNIRTSVFSDYTSSVDPQARMSAEEIIEEFGPKSDKRVLKHASLPYKTSQQNALLTEPVVQSSTVVEQANKVNSSFRAAFFNMVPAHGGDEAGMRTSTSVQGVTTAFEQMILDELNMISAGTHDASKLMRKLEEIIAGVINENLRNKHLEMYIGETSDDVILSAGFNLDLFTDEEIEDIVNEVNLIIDGYNDAIKKHFIDGDVVPEAVSGTFKKNRFEPTKTGLINAIGESVQNKPYKEFCSETWTSQFANPSFVYMTPAESVAKTAGNPSFMDFENLASGRIEGSSRDVAAIFAAIQTRITSQTDLNETKLFTIISEGILNLQKYEEQLERLIKEIENLKANGFSTTKKMRELEALKRDIKHEKARQAKLLMAVLDDKAIDVGLVSLSVWEKTRFGKKFFEAKNAEERYNVIFNMLYASKYRELMQMATAARETGNIEYLRYLWGFVCTDPVNGNPIDEFTRQMIAKAMLVRDTVADDGTGLILNENATEEQIKKAATSILSEFNNMLSDEIYLRDGGTKAFMDTTGKDTKRNGKLDHMEASLSVDGNVEHPKIPAIQWLLVKDDQTISDSGIMARTTKALVGQKNIYAENAVKMRNQIQKLEKYVEDHKLPNDSVMQALKDMGSRISLRLSNNFMKNQFIGSFSTSKNTVEKAQSQEEAAQLFAGILKATGRVQLTSTTQYTSGVNNTFSVYEFVGNRVALMNVLFGNAEYTITIRDYDGKGHNGSIELDQKTLLSLEENQEPTYKDIFDFLKIHPAMASWLLDSRVDESARNGNYTATINPTGEELIDTFAKRYSERNDVDSSEIIDGAQTIEEKNRDIILQEFINDESYLEFIMLQIGDGFDNIVDVTDAEREWHKAKKIVDDALIQLFVDDVINPSKDHSAEQIRESIKRSRDKYIYELLRPTDTKAVYNTGVIAAVNQNFQEIIVEAYFKMADEIYSGNSDATFTTADQTDIDPRIIEESLLVSLYFDELSAANMTKTFMFSEQMLDHVKTRLKAKYSQDSDEEFDSKFNPVKNAIEDNLRKMRKDFAMSDANALKTKLLSYQDTINVDNIVEIVKPYFDSFGSHEIDTTEARQHPDLWRVVLEINNRDVSSLNERDIERIIDIFHELRIQASMRPILQKSGDNVDNQSYYNYLDTPSEIVQRAIDRLKERFSENDVEKMASSITPSDTAVDRLSLNTTNQMAIKFATNAAQADVSAGSAAQIGLEGTVTKELAFISLAQTFECSTPSQNIAFADLCSRYEKYREGNEFVNVGISSENDFVMLMNALDITEGERLRKLQNQFEETNSIDLREEELNYFFNTVNGNRERTPEVTKATNEIIKNGIAVDVADRHDCKTGLCAKHSPGFPKWYRGYLAAGQENRLMKLKKVFESIHPIIKGDSDFSMKLRPKTKDLTPANVQDSLNAIFNLRDDFVKAYVDVINDMKDPSHNYLSYEKIDFETMWGGEHTDREEEFAKFFTPCIEVTFDNGAVRTYSIDQINEQDLAGAIKAQVRIYSPEEISINFVSNMMRYEEEKPMDEWDTEDWKSYSNRAFADWSYYNYADGKDFNPDTEGREKVEALNVNKILDELVFNTYNMPSTRLSPFDTPSTSMLMSALYPHRKKDRDGERGFQEPLKKQNAFKESDKSAKRNLESKTEEIGVKGPIVYIEGNRHRHSSNSSLTNIKEIVTAENSTTRELHSKGEYVSYGTVVIWNDSSMDDAELKKIFNNATKCMDNVLVDSANNENFRNACNLNRTRINPQEIIIDGETFYFYDYDDLASTRFGLTKAKCAGLREGFGNNHRVIVYNRHSSSALRSQRWDSFMALTPEMASLYQAEKTTHVAEYKMSSLIGHVGIEDVSKNKEELEYIREHLIRKLDEAVQDKDIHKDKNDNLSDYSNINFEDVHKSLRERNSDMADTVILQRMIEYIDNVIKDDVDDASYNQNDVIGIIASHASNGDRVFTPIVFNGSVPIRNSNGIEIEVKGTTTVVTYAREVDFSDGTIFKAYIGNSPGNKCEVGIVKDYEYDVHSSHNGSYVPIYGIRDGESPLSRETAAFDDIRKTNLFFLLRDTIKYNLLENPLEAFDLGRLSGVGVTEEELIAALAYDNLNRETWTKILSSQKPILKINGKHVSLDQWLAFKSIAQSCINAEINPAYLLKSTSKDGKWDNITMTYGDMIFNKTSGVSVDQVFTFCNMIDDTYCDSAAPVSSDDIFEKSDKFTDGIRMKSTEKVENETIESFVYFTLGDIRFQDNSEIGAINSSAKHNAQMDFVQTINNPGSMNKYNMRHMFEELRRTNKRYTRSDLERYQEDDSYEEFTASNGETYKIPRFDSRDKLHRMRDHIKKTHSDIVPANVLGRLKNEYLKRKSFHKTVGSRCYVRSHENENKAEKPLIRISNTNQFMEVRKILPNISEADYMELIEAQAGWTYVEGHEDDAMSAVLFERAAKLVQEQLENGKFPLVCKVDLLSTETRILSGLLPNERIGHFINVLKNNNPDLFSDLNTKEEEEKNESRLNEAKKQLYSNIATGTPQYNAIKKHLEFIYFSKHGFTDGSILGCLFERSDLRGVETDVLSAWEIPFADMADNYNDQYAEGKAYLEAMQKAKNDLDNEIIEAETTEARAISKLSSSNDTFKKVVNGVIKIRQTTAMLGFVMPVANIADTMRGNYAQIAGINLGYKGIGTYMHSAKQSIQCSAEVIDAASKSNQVHDVIEALRLSGIEGNEEEARLQMFMAEDSINGASKYLEDRKKRISSGEHAPVRMGNKIWDAAMRWGTMPQVTRRSTMRLFLMHFLKDAGYDGLTFLNGGEGVKSFETQLMENPGFAIAQLFSDPATVKTAQKAWNHTMEGELAQETMFSFFFEHMCEKHQLIKLTNALFGFGPFRRANFTIPGRALKSFIPGMSTVHYMLVDSMATKLNEDPEGFRTTPLGRAIEWMVGKDDFNAVAMEFGAKSEELKMFNDLREAIIHDMTSMAMPTFALVLALIPGLITPPDDDDKCDDYEEWKIFGYTISLSWWLKDLVGPVLPFAVWYKAGIMGYMSPSRYTPATEDAPAVERRASGLLANSIGDMINLNPFISFDTLTSALFDFDEVATNFAETASYYEDAPQGSPTFLQQLAVKGEIGILSSLSITLTPKFIREISSGISPYEVDTTHVYAENETGERIGMNEDGYEKTVQTTYADAQIRNLTKNNIAFGLLMNLKRHGTGYTALEMPYKKTYDPYQMDAMHTLSVWDYENDRLKSKAEIEQVCFAICSILDQNDDLDALVAEGFYIDSQTRQAVGDYIWKLYADEEASWTALSNETNGFDYKVLGNGDFNAGLQEYQNLKYEHKQHLNYLQYNLFDKLNSSALRNSLVSYNTYSTTKKKNMDGEWYNTGFHKDFLSSMWPVMVANVNDTDTDLATRSAVTGLGMYRNDNGEPMRAMVPTNASARDILDWDEMSEGLKDYSPNANDKTSTADKTKTPSGSGTRSSGGSGGRRGGGGSGGGGGYSRTANSTYALTGDGDKAVYTNGKTRINGHTVNYARPNYGNVMDEKRIYDASLDYLRPNFSTKGSRKAYKRGDF